MSRDSADDRRVTRVCATTLVLNGSAATLLVLAGLDLGAGSVWFPVSAVLGMLILYKNRPHKTTQAPGAISPGPLPERDTAADSGSPQEQ